MVGQLLAKLRELGIEDNTIVMYSTDNGSESFGMKVWQEPFAALRAPMLTNLRMNPFELAPDIGMDYERWFAEHMFQIVPAAGYVGQWLQSFHEFPPRQKPGSFNLDRVMEAVTSGNAGCSDLAWRRGV